MITAPPVRTRLTFYDFHVVEFSLWQRGDLQIHFRDFLQSGILENLKDFRRQSLVDLLRRHQRQRPHARRQHRRRNGRGVLVGVVVVRRTREENADEIFQLADDDLLRVQVQRSRDDRRPSLTGK